MERTPVPNLPLFYWSSQLFNLRTLSSTHVPVLLLNPPISKIKTFVMNFERRVKIIFSSLNVGMPKNYFLLYFNLNKWTLYHSELVLENSLQSTTQHNWTQYILQLSTMYFKEKKNLIKCTCTSVWTHKICCTLLLFLVENWSANSGLY